MKLARNLTVVINRLMDQLIPPIIRDARWFMYFPMKAFAKDKADIYLSFKDKAFYMSDEEYAEAYIKTGNIVQRETDLNEECLNEILNTDCGETVLEAGCGRGLLAGKLSAKYQVTGCDVVIDNDITSRYEDIKFVKTKLETLPFADNEFDTVICTHVLEHVLNPQRTIEELRRVAKHRLIIVVPCERPYKYTFSLHLHFFPYTSSLLFIMGKIENGIQSCRKLDGDWYYLEKYTNIQE